MHFRRYFAPLIALVVLLVALPAHHNKAAPSQATGQFKAFLPLVHSSDNGVANPDKGIYWGAAIDDVPFNMSKLDAFEAMVGKKVSIVHWGHPWAVQGVYQPFLRGEFNNVRSRGAIPMISWTSQNQGSGKDQPDFQLRDIYEGQHDAFIRQWATDAKNWGHPMFLRFDHEMNGWWFQWSENQNGNQPGDFVKAWRHVHDIFREVGATNVTWVWCVNRAGSPDLIPADTLYPGDAYVDWVALDAYNFGADGIDGWTTFDETVKPMYNQLVTIAPQKPVMIAEIASSEDGGPIGRPASKGAWITDGFVEKLPKNYPNIHAVVWFNSQARNSLYDWPVESSEISISAFAAAIAQDYYLANQYHNLADTPIAPPAARSATP